MKKRIFIILIMLTMVASLSACTVGTHSNLGQLNEKGSTYSFSESKETTTKANITEQVVDSEYVTQKENTSTTVIPKQTTTLLAKSENSRLNVTSSGKETRKQTTEKTTTSKKVTAVQQNNSTTKNTVTNQPTETTTIKSEFDVNYWVRYAKNYAVSVGLKLDSSATDCWDNPITANAKRKGLESDITSRLKRYKNVEEFSSVWVWAEKISSNEYEIYIGYA